MKYFLAITLLAIILFNPAFAQSKNPSLIVYNEEIPYYDFNRVARDTVIMEFDVVHEISWQITLENDLMYANPDGNAVLRFYDVSGPETFIEIGMGSLPDHKFWIAAQLPDIGYVVIQALLERGWTPAAKAIIAYTDQSGMTINNGNRIVVSNLDIGVFAIDSYSVHGMESSTDPPAVNSGNLKFELISGDPAQNLFHLFPFYITAAVGVIAGILFLTKKRS